MPDLVAVTNALFCPAFQASLGMSTADVALIAHRSAPSHGAPALEFFELTNDLVNKGDGLPKKLEKDRPARAITEGVRQLLSGTPRRLIAERSPETGRDMFRPVRPGDVAVLCRDNIEAAQIAGQLVAAGYSVSFSRAGLLATPEATLAIADKLMPGFSKTLFHSISQAQWHSIPRPPISWTNFNSPPISNFKRRVSALL